jgi:hypothetical protein
MNWPEVAKIIAAALLAMSGGSYVTHQHEQAETQQRIDNKVMSCSEIIQLVIQNQK